MNLMCFICRLNKTRNQQDAAVLYSKCNTVKKRINRIHYIHQHHSILSQPMQQKMQNAPAVEADSKSISIIW